MTPSRRSYLESIAALAMALSASSCAYQITQYETQPDMIRGTTATKATITVQWTDDVDAIGRACGSEGRNDGCATVHAVGPGENACTILIQRPKDFNDEARLKILGHEAMHCLGAKHKREL